MKRLVAGLALVVLFASVLVSVDPPKVQAQFEPDVSNVTTDRDSYVAGETVTVTFSASEDVLEQVASGDMAFRLVPTALTADFASSYPFFIRRFVSQTSGTLIAHDWRQEVEPGRAIPPEAYTELCVVVTAYRQTGLAGQSDQFDQVADDDPTDNRACFEVTPRPGPSAVAIGAPSISFRLPAVAGGDLADVQWSPDVRADGFVVRPHGFDRDLNPWSLPVQRVDDPIFAGEVPAGGGAYCVGVTAIGSGRYSSSPESVACVPFAESMGDTNCDGVAGSSADVVGSLETVAGLPNACLGGASGSGAVDIDGDGDASLLDALLMAQCDSGRANLTCPGLPADADPIEYFAYMLDAGAYPNRLIFEQLDAEGDDTNTRRGSLAAVAPGAQTSIGAQLLAENEIANPRLYGARDRLGNDADPEVEWSFDIPSTGEIETINARVSVEFADDPTIDVLRGLAGPQSLVVTSGTVRGATSTGLKVGGRALGVVGLAVGLALTLGGDSPVLRTDHAVYYLRSDGTQTFISEGLDDLRSTVSQLGDGDAVLIADYAERRNVTIDSSGYVEHEGNRWTPGWFEEWISVDRRAAEESLGKAKWRFRTEVGGQPNDGCDAHHIVPHGSTYRSAVAARAILNENGVGVHDPVNGVLLNRRGHGQLHTYSYYDSILLRLREAVVGLSGVDARRAVVATLESEAIELMNRYPCPG